MSAPDPSVDVVETRSAGWAFRCHRCDRSKFNLTEDAARTLAKEHVHDDQAPAPWRFDVPKVPARVVAIEDKAGWIWVREGAAWLLWRGSAEAAAGTGVFAYRLYDGDLIARAPLVECEDPRGTG